jgi:hypothetical protein
MIDFINQQFMEEAFLKSDPQVEHIPQYLIEEKLKREIFIYVALIDHLFQIRKFQ